MNMGKKKSKLTSFWTKHKTTIILAVILAVIPWFITLCFLPIRHFVQNSVSSRWKSPELKADILAEELRKKEHAYLLEGNLTDDLLDTIYVYGDRMRGKLWLQKTGKNPFFSNKDVYGGDVLSFIRIYFESWDGIMLGDAIIQPFNIPVDNKNNNILVLLDIPVPKEAKWELIIEVYCPNTEKQNCDTSWITKIKHSYKRQKIEDLKILIVDAAWKEYIQIEKFRDEIKEIFWDGKILKSAWSWDGMVYSKDKIGQAKLYYNHSKWHSDISDKTVMIKRALFDTFSHLQNNIVLAEYNNSTINWARDYLSDCEIYGADQRKWCQTWPGWKQLNQYSNRFSTSFLIKNPDLDFVIFLPY